MVLRSTVHCFMRVARGPYQTTKRKKRKLPIHTNQTAPLTNQTPNSLLSILHKIIPPHSPRFLNNHLQLTQRLTTTLVDLLECHHRSSR